MTENMKKFQDLLSGNEELAKKIDDMSREEIIAAAKQLGVVLAEADFEKVFELADDLLDAVAGGVGGNGSNGVVQNIRLMEKK